MSWPSQASIECCTQHATSVSFPINHLVLVHSKPPVPMITDHDHDLISKSSESSNQLTPRHEDASVVGLLVKTYLLFLQDLME